MRILEKVEKMLLPLVLIFSITASCDSGQGKLVIKDDEDEDKDEIEWVTNEKMPILSWHSVELISCTLENFMELKACGYTHSLSTIWSNEDPVTRYNAELLAKALDQAQEAGVKVLAGCHELTTDTENTVRRFKDHPAVVGWHLRDEPVMAEYPGLAELANKIKAIDKDNFIYINLRPSDATQNEMGAPDYATYISEYVRLVPIDFLSFDKYPCQLDKNGNLYVLDFWYDNLQIFANLGKQLNKDFWAFASGVKFETEQATPTIETLRLQMYTNLAYGAQGLQYFVYQNKTSPIWAAVKQMNEEIQNFAKVFLGANVISVTQTGVNIPTNTKRFEEAPDVIEKFETGDAGAVISVLEKGDRKFFVVVSRDINDVLPVTIEVDESVMQVTKKGTLKKVKGQVTENVTPGDILVYTWKESNKN